MSEEEYVTEELLTHLRDMYNGLKQIDEMQQKTDTLKSDMFKIVKETLQVISLEPKIPKEVYGLLLNPTDSLEDVGAARVTGNGHVIIEMIGAMSTRSKSLVDYPAEAFLRIVGALMPEINNRIAEKKKECETVLESLQRIKDTFMTPN